MGGNGAPAGDAALAGRGAHAFNVDRQHAEGARSRSVVGGQRYAEQEFGERTAHRLPAERCEAALLRKEAGTHSSSLASRHFVWSRWSFLRRSATDITTLPTTSGVFSGERSLPLTPTQWGANNFGTSLLSTQHCVFAPHGPAPSTALHLSPAEQANGVDFLVVSQQGVYYFGKLDLGLRENSIFRDWTSERHTLGLWERLLGSRPVRS